MDERLKSLIVEAKRASLATERPHNARKQLAEHLLKSSPLVSLTRKKFRAETYLELHQALQKQLYQEIDHHLSRYNLKSSSEAYWTAELLKRTYQTILNETYLKKLALEAQKQSAQSEEWQHAIQILINAILLSEKLLHKTNVDNDDYEEAKNELWIWVYQNIRTYDPEKGKFLAWLNYRFSQLLRKTQQARKEPFIQAATGKIIRTKYQLSSLIKKTGKSDLFFWLKCNLKGLAATNSLVINLIPILIVLCLLKKMMGSHPLLADALLFEMAAQSLPTSVKLVDAEGAIENIAQSEAEISLSEQLRQYLQADPDRLLQKHIRNHSEATFQVIALKRLDGKTWQEISQSLGVAIPALSNFFQRHLKKIAPEIRSSLQP